MPDYDPSAPPAYNSMQQQVGLLPPIFQPPPIPFPGQVSAAMAQNGVAGAAMLANSPNGSFMTTGSVGTGFGAGAFPAQQLQTFTNQSPMLQGPTGIMMPMNPGASFNSYAGANPYAGLAARGPYQGPPGLFTPMAPSAPPVYGGQYAPAPFAPSPSAQFNTPYMAGLERNQMSADAGYARAWSAGGVGARIATDFTGGMAGAMLGGRMGGGVGAVLGGFAGFLGSEMSGMGQFGQNGFMNQIASPFINQRAMAGGIEEMSRGFVNMGGSMHRSGMGFSHHAAEIAASGIRNMAGSSQFQKETGDRFNAQDLMKIAQESSRNDMMTGVQSPTQMTSRVREIAKSLSSFMELAQEPDIQRAIQTMGQLRSSGLNLAETQNAVSQGRSFARMAGTSFSDIASQAGAFGSQTFQSMGLSQGLGMQTGMMNYAQARAGQNAGMFSPQMMNMVGGAQGLANMNNMFSAGMLQMPMLAPSVMSSAGGINAGALQNLLGGGANAFGQTSNAVGALQGITGRQGVAGLGAAIAMQPLLQDTIGRALQAQGPFAQRNFEDRNIMSTMRSMGMSGSQGFMTMAQTMGMSPTQARARAEEMASPGYFDTQRQQIEITRADERASEIERREAMNPGVMATLGRSVGVDFGHIGRGISRGVSGALGLDRRSHYEPENDRERRRYRRALSDSSFSEFQRSVGDEASTRGPREAGLLEGIRDRYRVSQGEGFGNLAGIVNMGMSSYSDAELAPIMANQREGGRLAGLMVSSSADERQRGSAAMTSAFGSDAALRIQQGMAADVNSRLSESNGMGASFRNGANLVAGTAATAFSFVNPTFGMGAGLSEMAGADGEMFTGRQIGASDYQRIFMRNAARQNVSQDAAAEMWRTNSSAVMQSMTANQRLTASPEEEARLNAMTQSSAGAGQGRGAYGEVLREREDRARISMFGSESAELQDEFKRQMGDVEGLSPEGSEANTRERRYVMTAAMLSRQARLGTGSERDEAKRQLNEVQAAFDRSDPGKRDRLNDRIMGASRRLDSGTGADMAAAFTRAHAGQTGEQITSATGTFEDTTTNARNARRVQEGYAQLATGSGPLAEALKRAGADDSTTNNQAAIARRLGELSTSEIRDIERTNPDMARAIRNQRAGRRGAEGELNQAAAGYAARSEQLGEEYRSQSLGTRFMAALTSGGEEGYIAQNRGRSTEADRIAQERIAQTGSAEADAAAAGIGGAGDPMLQAASELRRAAELLSGAASSGSLDRAIDGNN